MPFDYQLVAGIIIAIFSFVGITNAMLEKRSPLTGLIVFLVGAGLIGWAWMLSDGTLNIQDVPDAVFRIIARWM